MEEETQTQKDAVEETTEEAPAEEAEEETVEETTEEAPTEEAEEDAE